jgi:hypothetical protein
LHPNTVIQTSPSVPQGRYKPLRSRPRVANVRTSARLDPTLFSARSRSQWFQVLPCPRVGICPVGICPCPRIGIWLRRDEWLWRLSASLPSGAPGGRDTDAPRGRVYGHHVAFWTSHAPARGSAERRGSAGRTVCPSILKGSAWSSARHPVAARRFARPSSCGGSGWYRIGAGAGCRRCPRAPCC